MLWKFELFTAPNWSCAFQQILKLSTKLALFALHCHTQLQTMMWKKRKKTVNHRRQRCIYRRQHFPKKQYCCYCCCCNKNGCQCVGDVHFGDFVWHLKAEIFCRVFVHFPSSLSLYSRQQIATICQPNQWAKTNPKIPHCRIGGFLCPDLC